MAVGAIGCFSNNYLSSRCNNVGSSHSPNFTGGNACDTYSSSKGRKNLSDVNVKVGNGFLGLGKRTIKGDIRGKQVDLLLDTNFWTSKVKLSGTVNNKPVNLTLKGYNIEGNIAEEDKDLIPYLRVFMSDKRHYDDNIAMIAACS